MGGDLEGALDHVNVPSYVIDRAGVVRHVVNSQIQIGRHIDSALAVVRELQAGRG